MRRKTSSSSADGRGAGRILSGGATSGKQMPRPPVLEKREEKPYNKISAKNGRATG